jgi:hypothetical protein
MSPHGRRKRSAWVSAAVLLQLTLPAAAWAACTGDCDRDGAVRIDELVRAVDLALSAPPAGVESGDVCSLDRDASGSVSVNEIVTAVRRALGGCPKASARRIESEADLIGGPMAVGRVGDYLLANDRIRVVLRDVGREFSFLLTYGGNIVDADVTRPPGEPGRDQFGAMTPQIDMSSTVNVTGIEIAADGSDGRAAVIRTTGVDDLLDAINPADTIRRLGLGELPPSAHDVDLPIEVCTTYRLEPEEDAVRIETAIHNRGDQPLRLYVGDYLNGGGEVDTFGPGTGFGQVLVRPGLPFLAFAGVGGGAGVSYALLPVRWTEDPDIRPGATTFQGIASYSFGPDYASVLREQPPGSFSIDAGQSRSFVRYFAVGRGFVDSVDRIRNRLLGVATGEIRGRVTAGGIAVAGAVVSAARKPGSGRLPLDVVDAARTDSEGRYALRLGPGEYILLARLDGYPYDSLSAAPEQHPVAIDAGRSASADLELPATGRLRVRVADPSGRPLPAKVTLVGTAGSPNLRNGGGFVFPTDIANGGTSIAGIANVLLVGAAGDTGEVPIPPGEYEVVVSHGPEYSAHRERLRLESGATTEVTATLARVVDTAGFVSADFHVHLLNSVDSQVTPQERILTTLAEDVEYFAATDHDFLTNLAPEVARLGVARLVRPVVGQEITMASLGHFNMWPLERDPRRAAGGPIDWGRAGVSPGMDYPSLGSYDLSPAELYAAAPPGAIVQINHINSAPPGSFFDLAGVDTGRIPPQTFTDPGLLRQDPALANLWDDGFTSLELWNRASRHETALLLDANLGDWFNLLNQGRVHTATADSDSHQTAIIQAGGPRSLVASPTDVVAELDDAALADSVRAGRVVCSNAPFVRVELTAGAETAGLALGQERLIGSPSGRARLAIEVQSPIWAEFDTVEVYVDTVPSPVPDTNANGANAPRYVVSPTLTRHAGTDFEIRSVAVDPDIAEAVRLQADLSVDLELERDAWVVVLVRGTDGVSRPLWPINPLDLRAAGNATLDQLTDGNLGEGGNLALAFTNPLFVDVDGNGRFDPSFAMPSAASE